jgi:RimJ/RimL family protein N-acetyltransferase
VDTLSPKATTVVPYPVDLSFDGVRLRPYRDADAPALLEAVRESIATVGHWLPWCNERFSLESANEWIAYCKRSWLLGDHYEFAIVDSANEAFLGGIGINERNREHRFANLGYWIRERRQGEGIATQAVQLATGFGFGAIGLSRIEIVAAEGNLPSRRLAEKVGARYETTARNRLVLHEVPVDAAVYSLIPSL